MKTSHRPPRTPSGDEEQAYRRGCHQTAARLRDFVADRCESLPQAVKLLGWAEAVLGMYREGRADPGDRLLDELETCLFRRATPDQETPE